MLPKKKNVWPSGIFYHQSSHCEDNIVLNCQAAHVKNSIAHATQRSVDAHISAIGNLLEAHVLVVTHEQNFSLIGWQSSHQFRAHRCEFGPR